MNLKKFFLLTIFGILALVPAIVLFVFLFAFQRAKPDTSCAGEWGPVTYLHRGNLKFAQENTYDSVVVGTALNGNNPEIDVTALKDGTAILFHDKNMVRMTGVNKQIKDVNAEEALNVPILKVIDGYSYFFNNRIPELKPVVDAICDTEESIGINFDTKDAGAVEAGVSALKNSNCDADTGDKTIWSTPYPGVVKSAKKHLQDAGMNNRISIYMPSGSYSFLGLKFFLQTRLLQAVFARGSSILSLHKLVHDAEPELIQSWVDDGWCIGIWGIKPDEVSDYEADYYVVDEAPEFPNLVGTGRLGGDGEPTVVTYDDNSLLPYYCLVLVAIVLLNGSIALFVTAARVLKRNGNADDEVKEEDGDSESGTEEEIDIERRTNGKHKTEKEDFKDDDDDQPLDGSFMSRVITRKHFFF